MADASQAEGFILDRPLDASDYPDAAPGTIDRNDEARMASLRKYEQSLAAQGIKLSTPTFPELFGGETQDGG